MRKTVVKPLYRMSLADLIALKDKVIFLIDRDGTILVSYGIDDATKEFLDTTTETLMALPSDVYLKGQVGVATQDRNDTADAIKVAIRDIMLRPKLKWGEDSPEYRSFGTVGMDKLDHPHLYFCANIVVQVAEVYLTQLSPFGLTQEIIDALKTLNATYHQQIIDKVKAVALRDTYTEQRITLANQLYSRIVQICEVGKTYWFDKNEANYNDYVIYNTPDMKKPEEGQYGSVHGTLLRSDNNQCPENGLVYIDGVQAPIVPDENGNWEMDTVPVGKRAITATGDECIDFAGEVEVLPDDDVEYNILITPVGS
jgi:hypothetical protein